MKKKIGLMVLAFMLFASVVSASSINGDYNGDPIVKVKSNGKDLLVEDVPAIIYNGRTMVPIYMLKQLRNEVTWDGNTYSVEIDSSKINAFGEFSDFVKLSNSEFGQNVRKVSINIEPTGTYLYIAYMPPAGIRTDTLVTNLAAMASSVVLLKNEIDGTIIDFTNDDATRTDVRYRMSYENSLKYANNTYNISQYAKTWTHQIYDN